jgi:PadR family transcriptional regulator PadR
MAVEPQLSHAAAMILQAILAGRIYVFGVMEVTGLPSGTVPESSINGGNISGGF